MGDRPRIGRIGPHTAHARIIVNWACRRHNVPSKLNLTEQNGNGMAGHGKAIKDQALAQLLPTENSAVKPVSREIGLSVAELKL